MNAVLADSFYYLALINLDDESHRDALSVSLKPYGSIVTTEWILVEVADALARRQRTAFAVLYREIRSTRNVIVVPSSPVLLEQGLALYNRHTDKKWSLTDCLSFALMRRDGITDALTGDRHFEQAGFNALLRTR